MKRASLSGSPSSRFENFSVRSFAEVVAVDRDVRVQHALAVTGLVQVDCRSTHRDLDLLRAIGVARVALVRFQARRHRARSRDLVHGSIATLHVATATENDSDLAVVARRVHRRAHVSIQSRELDRARARNRSHVLLARTKLDCAELHVDLRTCNVGATTTRVRHRCR